MLTSAPRRLCAPSFLRPVVSAPRRFCAPSSLLLNSLLLMATLAFSLLAAPDVRAGTYSGPVYSGGLTTDGTNFNPYTSGNPGWTGGIGGGCSAHGVGPTMIGLSNSGKITAAFTWQPSYPGEMPPANVIVYQHCVARWGGGTYNSGGTVSGACDNGLKGPVVPYPPDPRGGVGASCESATYTVQSPSGDGSVTMTCSPSSSLNGDAGSGMAQGTCSVEYDTSVTPVLLSLGGTTLDSSGNQNILIGQGCKPSMTAGGYTLSGFQWSASPIFDQFLIASDQSSGYATFLSAAALTQPNPTWHWYLDSGGGEFMVSCSATAGTNGTTIGTVNGQQQVKVWAPYYYMSHNAGPTGIYGSDVSTGAQSLVPPGMAFVGAVGTPALFANNLGTGSWLFVQIINTSHYQWYPWSPIPVKSGSLGVALDNEWPYIPGWPADSTANASTPHPAEDSPDLGLLNLVDQFTVNDIYQMYLMYLPPDNGYGSQYVPLHRLIWEWNANGTLNGTWPAGSSGQVTVDSDLRWETHPSWSQIYINSHK